MSKSLGNFWTIKDILSHVDAMVLRFALINAHYRSPIDMNEALLRDAERNYNKLLETYVEALKLVDSNEPVTLPTADFNAQDELSRTLAMLERLAEGFAQAMDDDFNSREAIAKVLAMVREIGKLKHVNLDQADRHAFAVFVVELLEETAGRALGLLPSREDALAEPEDNPRKVQIAEHVEALLVQRDDARAAKDWGRADAIRDELNQLGVIVTDTADGPVWDLA